MQKITVKEIRGPLGKGKQKFYAVVAEGIKKDFTSFDSKLAHIKVGSILNVELRIDGDYVNIEKWELVSEPLGDKSPEAKSPEIMKLQIDAQFRITALTLAINGVEPSKVFITADSFYDWLARRKGSSSEPEKTADEDWENLRGEDTDVNPIKNVGDLLTRSLKIGMSRRDVLSIAEVGTAEELVAKDLDAIWLEVQKRAPKNDESS